MKLHGAIGLLFMSEMSAFYLMTLCPREAYDFNQKAVLVQRDLNPLFTFFSYFAIARSITILSEQNDTYIIVCVSLIA